MNYTDGHREHNTLAANAGKIHLAHFVNLRVHKDGVPTRKMKPFLTCDNKKLGRQILDFSLPPIVTCPDCSECMNDCYAVTSYRMYDNVKAKYDLNFSLAVHMPEYLEACLVGELERTRKRMVRLHASGDFFSADYFRMWVRIANRFPEIKFFTYTKSRFMDRSLLPENFNVISSFIDGKLNFGSPEYVLELRAASKGIICPATRGVKKPDGSGKDIQCSDCKYCVTKGKPVFVNHKSGTPKMTTEKWSEISANYHAARVSS